MKKQPKVLILGGAGFLGSNLARYALKKGATVTILDSLDPRFKSTLDSLKEVLSDVTFVKADIRDEKVLQKVIPGQDVIFNLAAQTSHPYSMIDPVLDADITKGVLHVLLAVRDLNPKARVVYAGSSTAVGKARKKVIDEDHPELPLDIYSAHKGLAEKYHYIFHNAFGIPVVNLRFANLYGPYGKNDPQFGFVNYFIEQAREGKPLTIFGDGRQTRNVMFVEDACDILWRAGKDVKLVGRNLFAVHHEHHSVRDIAEAIADAFGVPVSFVPWPHDRKKIDIDSVRISSKRLSDLTGWKPKHSLKEGMRKTKKHGKK